MNNRAEQIAVVDERTGAKLREATPAEVSAYWREQRDPRYPVTTHIRGAVLLWTSNNAMKSWC